MTLEAGGICLDARLVDVGLRLEPGRIHALVGPNGAGKSSLLRVLSGELAPDRGQVLIDGRALRRWEPRALARRRAVLPQTDHLHFALSAWEVATLGLTPYPELGERQRQQRVAAALAAAQALELAPRPYTQLSAGEKLRVRWARVLAQVGPFPRTPGSPAPLLMLDEPTAHLDPAYQLELLRSLGDLAGQGCALLVVLHDLNLALQLAQDATLMHRGRVLAQGRTLDVLHPDPLLLAYGLRFGRHRIDGREWLLPAHNRTDTPGRA